MKLFKYLIDLKIKRLDGNDRIIFLANKLVKEINGQGYSIMNPSITSGFGSVDLNIHRYGTVNPVMYINKIIENGGNKFEFQGIPEEGLK